MDGSDGPVQVGFVDHKRVPLLLQEEHHPRDSGRIVQQKGVVQGAAVGIGEVVGDAGTASARASCSIRAGCWLCSHGLSTTDRLTIDSR